MRSASARRYFRESAAAAEFFSNTQHDRDFKVRTARKLLNDGNKVKVSVMFRAREITHPEVAKDLLDEFALELEDTAGIERNPALEGRFMSMTLDPSRKGQRSSIAKENTIEQTDNVVESVNVSESENEIA